MMIDLYRFGTPDVPLELRRQGETSQWWARGELNPHVLADTGT
jgi:hypothetical protein